MKKNNKGFTLMEMLIVVAIIAVLVAIAIPTFSNQLTKAKQAADNANVRAAYAEAMSRCLVGDYDTTGTTTTTTVTVEVAGTMQEAYDGKTKIGDMTLSAGAWTKGGTVKVVATDSNGTITCQVQNTPAAG